MTVLNVETPEEPIDEQAQSNWREYNNQFISIYNNLRQLKILSPKEAAELFTQELTKFLESKADIVKKVNNYFRHKPPSTKELEESKQMKKMLEMKSRDKNSSEEEKVLPVRSSDIIIIFLKNTM